MAPNRSFIDPAERERIAETRRRFMEALQRGASQADAEAYSRGADVALPAEVKTDDPPKNDSPVAEPRDEQRAVVIPDDWETLPYVPREAGALSLRALASQVSNTPISNKKQAEKAIRDELALREKEAGEARSAVVIPDDWHGQSLEDRIKLAANFTEEKVETAGDAERVIETELARRAV